MPQGNTVVPIGQFLPFVPVNIQGGQPFSNTIETNGMCLCGILMPAAFTGTAITFYAKEFAAGGVSQIYNANGAVSYPAAAGQFIAIDPKDFQGVYFLVLKSNATEASERDFTVAMKGL